MAMLQESYERDDRGNVTRIQELERRAGMSDQQVAHILKRSDEQLREAAQYIDIQRGKTKLSEDQAQHFVRIYGEYQEEARHKVLEYEKRHQEMAATVDLLEHRIRCEEGSTLVSKNKAEQERRRVSSEIAQYQSMINSYQVKKTKCDIWNRSYCFMELVDMSLHHWILVNRKQNQNPVQAPNQFALEHWAPVH